MAQRVPGGLGSHISWHSAHEGGEVSLTHRPTLPPRKCSWYSFSLGTESTPGPWYGRKEYVTEKSSDTTGIDPGTVRQVALRLNHCATPGPMQGCTCLKFCVKHTFYANYYIALSALSVQCHAYVSSPNLFLQWANKCQTSPGCCCIASVAQNNNSRLLRHLIVKYVTHLYRRENLSVLRQNDFYKHWSETFVSWNVH